MDANASLNLIIIWNTFNKPLDNTIPKRRVSIGYNILESSL